MTAPALPDLKPGRKTTEAVFVALSWVAAFVTMHWHHDFSSWVPVVTPAVAGAATIAYAWMRTHLKKSWLDTIGAVYEQRALIEKLIADLAKMHAASATQAPDPTAKVGA